MREEYLLFLTKFSHHVIFMVTLSILFPYYIITNKLLLISVIHFLSFDSGSIESDIIVSTNFIKIVFNIILENQL